MKPKFRIHSVNSYPVDEHDPKRSTPVGTSAEIYLPNPCHPKEWLCVASFLDINAVEFFVPPEGVPFAIYHGDTWLEVVPMPD